MFWGVLFPSVPKTSAGSRAGFHLVKVDPQLGLLRPEEAVTLLKHALYQRSLPSLSNPQDITGSGELF